MTFVLFTLMQWEVCLQKTQSLFVHPAGVRLTPVCTELPLLWYFSFSWGAGSDPNVASSGVRSAEPVLGH